MSRSRADCPSYGSQMVPKAIREPYLKPYQHCMLLKYKDLFWLIGRV